ncbi:MAG: CRISPR system precrRNA processing endoribonuclease RAMP protein Cas6 [Pseudonocardiales bacterium]|nr:CRISPR system precrRNA processing endoribonuclease RAMP protein Cas6 [Pseudonocardiales bacterium]
MPAIIELDLDLAEAPTIYPARLHGAACALLEPSAVPHDSNHKPFSVWPLIGDGPMARWRLGWLSAVSPTVSFGPVTFGSTSHRVVRHRTEQISFADLARTPPRRRARVEAVSPLYFSRNGRDHPLPDPVLITRSALDRWDRHAPPALVVPESARRELLSTIYLAEMEGCTVEGAVGARTSQSGFVGVVELALTRAANQNTASLFAALLRFAGIAGIGAQTTHGFGAVRVLPTDRDRPSAHRARSARSSRDHRRSSRPVTDASVSSPAITGDRPEPCPRGDQSRSWSEPPSRG